MWHGMGMAVAVGTQASKTSRQASKAKPSKTCQARRFIFLWVHDYPFLPSPRSLAITLKRPRRVRKQGAGA